MVSLAALASQRDTVVCRDRGDTHVGTLISRHPDEMIQTGGRQPRLPPIVHCRNTGLGEPVNFPCATERVDDGIRECIHRPQYAETAHAVQAVLCRNGICQYGTPHGKQFGMDLDEIKERMKLRGYQQADLANLLGIVPSAVSRRLTGIRPFKHAEMLKVDAWLSDQPETEVTGGTVRLVPIIGQVAAGSWREAIQQPSGHIPIAVEGSSSSEFALRVAGDSMDLEIDDGGIVIVDPQDRSLFPGRLYVVLNDDGDATFKQFEAEPARLVPRSTNSSHRPIEIGDGVPFTIVGRVTALYRPR